jgi:DNA-directed RNA polymerase specialized sigma24 family protein
MLPQPTDGWSTLEKLLLRSVIINMYKFLDDPLDRFILMASVENNYRQEEIGQMCGISQVAINKRLKRTKLILRNVFDVNTIDP